MDLANHEFQTKPRNVLKVIIIVSDGEIDDLNNATAKVKTMYSNIHLVVYGIRIGDKDVDEGVKKLNQLTGNSNFVFVTDESEILETFKKLDLCL